MKRFNGGCFIRVYASSDDVEAFADRWPCSNFRYGDHVMVEFDKAGNIVDLSCKGTYGDIFEGYDESAMSALVEDLKAYAFKKGKQKVKVKTWSKEGCNGGALNISREEFIALGLPESAIEKGELRGKMKTFGPWQIPVSYKALAMSVVYTPKEKRRYSAEQESVTAYGIRTLFSPRQEGYDLEGMVSVNGEKYRAFTSSQLFEVDGKLIDVAVIHVCIPK